MNSKEKESDLEPQRSFPFFVTILCTASFITWHFDSIIRVLYRAFLWEKIELQLLKALKTQVNICNLT